MNLRLLLAYSALLLGLTIIPALLMRRGGNGFANRLLAASLALQLPLPLTVVLGLELDYQQLWLGKIVATMLPVLPTFSLLLLIGYIRAMIDPAFRLRIADVTLALPLLVLLPITLAAGDIGPEALQQAQGGWPPNRLTVVGIVYYLFYTLYLLYAERLLWRHRRRVEHLFSSKTGVDLRGIHWCIRIFLGLMALGLLISVARLFPDVVPWPRLLYSIGVTATFFYLIALLAVTQPAIFAGNPPAPLAAEPEPTAAPGQARSKYETSALTDETAQQQWQRLRALLQREKPWLKNDLRLSELAELAQLPAYQLSQIINQCAGKNFFELMNGYRLEEAKRLLVETPPVKIAAVALESGYNSQSVFYKHFKQATGLTPSAFRRQADGRS